MLRMLYDMNTRRHTNRYLLALSGFMVSDFIALCFMEDPFASCILFILLTINLILIVKFSS